MNNGAAMTRCTLAPSDRRAKRDRRVRDANAHVVAAASVNSHLSHTQNYQDCGTRSWQHTQRKGAAFTSKVISREEHPPLQQVPCVTHRPAAPRSRVSAIGPDKLALFQTLSTPFSLRLWAQDRVSLRRCLRRSPKRKPNILP